MKSSSSVPSYPSRAQWLRRLARKKRDKVGFVFSGGGPLGAMQVGAVQALFEANVVPGLTAGTSVGALNATFVGFNPTISGAENLLRIWQTLEESDLFPGGRFRASWARFLTKGNKVFENTGMKRLVERRLGNARFEDAQIPIGVVATDLDTGDEKLFTTGPVTQALLASTSMPGVFPPVEIDGRLYTDGGVSNNVPIAPAVNMGAKTIYVMNSTSHSHQKRPLNRPIDYMLHAFTLARSQRLQLEQRMYSDKVRVIMLPTPTLDFFVPFASLEFTQRLIDLGYEATSRFLSGATDVAVEEVSETNVEVIAPAK
jgi:NTE family protein